MARRAMDELHPLVRAAFACLTRGLAVLAVCLPAPAFPAPAGAVEIAISCGAAGRELALCREGAQDWARQSGHAVRIISTPNDASARFALYQQLLAARSPEIDVLQIDVIWPGALAAHLLDLSPFAPPESQRAHLPQLIANNTIDGRLVALPWFVDVGLLYYRRDLLAAHGAELPRTWHDLTATATRIQAAERTAGNTRLWGYVFQGRSYEGLTCNALEWIASSGGGRLLDADGAPTVDNPQAAAALDLARSWIGGIAPPGVLNYAEEEARSIFQAGNAVFMRNWPYAWALAEADGSPVAGKVGVTALPSASGGPGAGTLGGAELAVSRYSRHPAEAAALALHLTSAAEQRRRALSASFAPSRPALYEEPDLRQAQPLMAILQPAIDAALARPVREAAGRYNRISSAFWLAAHATLSGEADGAASLGALAERIPRLMQARP